MIQTKRIVLLFGKICSGKSTYANALSYITKAKRITVSDIVNLFLYRDWETLREPAPSTKGPGWTHLWCIGCHASGIAE